MDNLVSKLEQIKKGIGRSRFSTEEFDSLEDAIDRLENLETVLNLILDIMLEAAKENG